MLHPAYPEDIDWEWFCADSFGSVGVFFTAGRAPIPVEVLRLQWNDPDVTGDFFKYPRIVGSDGDIIYQSTYEYYPERGIFVFDWSDIHRIRDYLNQYEFIAAPFQPAKIADFPPSLVSRIPVILDHSVRFADRVNVDVRRFFDCVEGDHC
ncbi:hypothetical protein [Oleomonas cavernae]|uniref:hypothetical protein n=1 Tax=Oleomonas cavernae TaxID=2320859 RepID=UPI0011C42C42|nr:hypothetical protein [Oleomonas cavernae]